VSVKVRIVVTLDPEAATPRDLREAFATALRSSIQRAWASGRIDTAQAEELLRTVPEIAR
jgi:hypothetical protein